MSEEKLLDVMRRFWGYSHYLPNQREAMQSICADRDCVVVLPTGGGKSLCFQAPAIAHGRAIVVSPLIALMHDQVAALEQSGVPAACLNSTMPQAEAGQAMVNWRTGKLALLYVAPERLTMPAFLNWLEGGPPAFFAIDEAHCISHWGHDFRPEYRRLSVLRERFPAIPIAAFTATATDRVRGDIVQQLALRDPQVLVGDFHRKNLHYRVERRTDRNVQVAEILRAHEGKSGIVYCITRNDVETLAAKLAGNGFRVAAYHAGLDAAVRRKAQAAFSNEDVDAIVATVAFGMGIDRSNVRFVVHAAMPRSVETYQQETGRAGRDGLPAECVLLYSPGDTMKWRKVLEGSPDMPPELLRVHLQKLREMDSFASSPHCRHRYLVEYFGQDWGKGPCGNCDTCSDGPGGRHPDSPTIARKILSCIVRLDEQYGAGYVAHVLHGDTVQLQPVHCGLSTFGLLADSPLRLVRVWIDECVGQGLAARTEDQYAVLQVTPQGWAVMRGEAAAILSPGSPASGTGVRERRQKQREEHRQRGEATLTIGQQLLFESLRKMRSRIARETGRPAYMILTDATLVAIAQLQPQTADELAAVPGIGEAKLRLYAGKILPIVQEHAD